MRSTSNKTVQSEGNMGDILSTGTTRNRQPGAIKKDRQLACLQFAFGLIFLVGGALALTRGILDQQEYDNNMEQERQPLPNSTLSCYDLYGEMYCSDLTPITVNITTCYSLLEQLCDSRNATAEKGIGIACLLVFLAYCCCFAKNYKREGTGLGITDCIKAMFCPSQRVQSRESDRLLNDSAAAQPSV